jgi:hypothetical protein
MGTLKNDDLRSQIRENANAESRSLTAEAVRDDTWHKCEAGERESAGRGRVDLGGSAF